MPRDDFGHGHGREQRRPQVELVRTQVKRDGTTGMPIDEVADPFRPNPTAGIAANLRGREAQASTPAAADFGGDGNYLDIPAFLRRQAD